MPVRVEARRISGVDIGKTITATDLSGAVVTGELVKFEQSRTLVWVRVITHGTLAEARTYPGAHITITGKESPCP